MAQGGSEGRGYVAFISYSHKDAAIGRWLHRRLEGYRIPKRLAGSEGEQGPVPARLTPIFRDRDELPAAGDLSERVRAALAVSDNLIVVCSPNSAGSPWVAKEIETFRALRPGRPIFTAIVEGEPSQCFPPALREDGVEPLAADLRREGDGRRLGVLKLVAGLSGVGLDALVQRDAQRHLRRVTAVTLGAVAAMLAMAVLTILALSARAEAERQRAEAEGLVEFMLTDLRDRLKGVGRLDVLTAVNERALEHYRGQDLEDLPASSLERRARILHAMGEDDGLRGHSVRALRQYREAHRTTAVLLADAPNDPQRIFVHSQSEYWIGNHDYLRGSYAAARRSFERYKALTDRLVALDGANPEWLKEAAYAEGNLCSTILKEAVDAAAALSSCAASLAKMKRAAAAIGDPAMEADIANRQAWLADAYRAAGDLQRARALRGEQARLIDRLLARDPRNMDYKDLWLTLQYSVAALEAEAGETAAARKRLEAALGTVEKMIAADSENQRLVRRKQRIREDLARLRGRS
jgi:hypothetical protein